MARLITIDEKTVPPNEIFILEETVLMRTGSKRPKEDTATNV